MSAEIDSVIEKQPLLYADQVEALLSNTKVSSTTQPTEVRIESQAKSVVLVIDDDPTQLFSIQKILEDSYHLLICDRGLKAIELYRHEQDQVSAILLDIRLPDIEGFDVFRKLKGINHNIPIIFITGYQGVYGDGFEIYKEYRPHGYIVKNHENEMEMIRDTLATAVSYYKKICESEKGKILAARNQLMAGLLHDLKNMFTPIYMLPGLMIRVLEAQQIDRLKEMLSQLKKAVNFYSANQQIFFNYAKGEHVHLNLNTYSFPKIINDFLDIVRVQFEGCADIKTHFEFQGEILTDENTLCCQVLLNIMKNSKEAFVHLPGTIIIEGYSVEQYLIAYGESAKFSGKDSRDLILVVRDNGSGIPKELEANLFRPYVTYGKEEGTGLGTWMIRNGIVELLKGDFVLDNRPGEGVAFHIWLPQLG